MKTPDLFPCRVVPALMALGMILAGESAFAQTAAPAIAATAITKVPYLIKKPGLYVLKKDVVFTPTIAASGQAITINASDVTLDLGGRIISTTAPQNATNTTVGIGLASAPTPHVTIRNGTLRNFNQGIFLPAGGAVARVLVEDMFISNSVTEGIRVEASSIEIRRCKIVDTGYFQPLTTTFGIVALGEGVTRIVDNDVANSAYATGFLAIGISTRSGIVERNRVRGQGIVGIDCHDDSFALENVISGFQTGIQSATADVKYRGNTTLDCQTPFSGGTPVGTENN
jgi:hypothetical protein